MNITEAKSERIAARITPYQKTILVEAAALRGRSLTEFVIEVAQREAQNVLKEERIIRLSSEYQSQLAKALATPPQPNAALTNAARAYDKKGIVSI